MEREALARGAGPSAQEERPSHVRRRFAGREGQAVPGQPRRLSDEGRPGRGPLRRQGQEPAQPGRPLLHQGRRRGPPHRRPRQAHRRHRLPAGRQRGGRPAAGGPPRQGHSAALQRRAEGRQDVSLPADPHTGRIPARRVHAVAAAPRRQAVRPVHQRPHAAPGHAGACSGSSSSAPVRWTSARTTSRWRWFRPCLLHSIRQCTAPCNFRVTRGGVPQADPQTAAGAGRQEGRG